MPDAVPVDVALHEQRQMHEDQRCACVSYPGADPADYGCVLAAEVERRIPPEQVAVHTDAHGRLHVSVLIAERNAARDRVVDLEAALLLVTTTDPITDDGHGPYLSEDWRAAANRALALLGRDPSWREEHTDG